MRKLASAMSKVGCRKRKLKGQMLNVGCEKMNVHSTELEDRIPKLVGCLMKKLNVKEGRIQVKYLRDFS